MACITSLRMPPQKKQMAVNIVARWRQNQTRRASLHPSISNHDDVKSLGSLIHINDEIEHYRCDKKTEEMQNFVVNWERSREIGKSQKCKDSHDDACK